MKHECDIIVVGAGLVGLSAAISFTNLGKKVVLVGADKAENNMAQSWDERIYALTPATEIWFKKLGVWQFLDKTRINSIYAMHLWNSGLESPLVLSDSDANLKELGIIAENRNLMYALEAKLDKASGLVLKYATCVHIENSEHHVCLTLDDGAQVSAKLLVAADGANSFVRNALNISTKLKKFDQTAIVANFSAEKNHANIARQWFSPHETLAMLPLPNKHVSMVWSVSTERAEKLLSLSREKLTQLVQSQFEDTLGKLEQVSEVLAFPLEQATATQLIGDRVALVGDAAHRVHPMAGQGVNLGFRDVIAVQKLLAEVHALQDIGEQSFLRQYERSRKADIMSMNGLTSGLDWLFANEQRKMKNLTNFGIRQLNRHSAMKKILIKQAVA